MPETDLLQDLITSGEAATMLAAHRSTVERRIKAGALPGVLLGGVWIVRRSDVVRLSPELKQRGGAGEITSPTLDGTPLVTLESSTEEAA